MLVAAAFVYGIVSPARTPKANGSGPRVASNPIAVGIILPIRLDHTVSADDAKPGEEIEAHIMQDVPLPNHGKIRLRAEVRGTVVSVRKTLDGNGVEISLRFDKIEYDKKLIPITTSLRAMASFEAVHAAQFHSPELTPAHQLVGVTRYKLGAISGLGIVEKCATGTSRRLEKVHLAGCWCT